MRIALKKNQFRNIIILILFLSNTFHLNAQYNQGNCPNNIDLEFGDFTNWVLKAGKVNVGSGTPTYNWFLFGPTPNQQEIISSTTNSGQTDPYGGFPVTCPNGSNYSVKLGNNLASNGAETMKYIFTVPAGSVQYSITYYYACVLFSGGSSHTNNTQPRFTVSLKNELTNTDISSCSSFDYNANTSNQGFLNSPSNSNIKYKTWTPVTIDLTGLNGLTLSLEFLTNDCTVSGGTHFGYAYIDVGSTCITPVTGYAYCNGANSITLSAPFGYQNYNWYDQNYTTVLSTSQTFTISPPPANGTVYNIDLIPFPFGGCRDTLPVTIEAQTPPDTPVAQSLITYCINEVPSQLTANNLSGYLLQWYSMPIGGTASNVAPIPTTNAVGNTDYYVSQISFGGCEGPRKKITVSVIQPVVSNFSINDTIQCISNNNFVFTNLTTQTGTIFSWDFGDGTPIIHTINATHTYTTLGNHTVTLTAGSGNCTSTISIPINVYSCAISNFNLSNSCTGQSVLFTNTTTGGSTSNTFTWSINGTIVGTQTNLNYTFTAPGTYNINLKVDDGTYTNNITKQIIINPVPIAKFTYTTACVGDSLQFIDASTIATGTITNWLWNFGNGNTSILQNPKMAFSNYGIQNVQLTVSSATCSKDTTISINVNEKPIAKFNRLDTACLNQLTHFQDASYFASGAAYSGITNWWYNTNGTQFNNPNFSTTYNTVSNNYLVQQVVTSSQGCKSDTNKVLVNVNALPIATANILTPLCENRSLKFQDASSPNIKTRNWTFSNGFTSNNSLITINNLSNGINHFKLQVIDSFGCISLPLDSNITVFKRPNFSFQYQDSCVEKPVPFIAIDNNVNYITNWFWNFEGNTIELSNPTSHLFSKYGNNIVFAYAVAANGCVSDSVYKTIKINYSPVNAGTDVMAAANENIQLNATGGLTYLWTPNIGLNNDTAHNPIATNTISRIYKVQGTSQFGCKSYDDVEIKIYKGPDIYVPSGFTPNNDGLNDRLVVTLIGIKEYKGIRIYNRWGKLIFESKNADISWDGKIEGKLQNTESYVYFAEGISIYNKNIYKKGTIVLIR